MSFQQSPPAFPHPFESDALLREFLRWAIPAQELDDIEGDLLRFGDQVLSRIDALALQAEASPPRHIPYNAWGERIDHIQVSSAWQELEELAAREGMIALGYGQSPRRIARLHQMAKIYLFHPSSAFVTCPLAMTDGAAKLIETMLQGTQLSELARKELPGVYARLIDRRPQHYWTSGQWMTEKSGGSDVGASETLAQPADEQGWHTLHGIKWFASATTSPVAFTLAKLPADQRLSLFFLPVRDSRQELHPGIKILRLKDKLGTRALPTAEIELMGARALLVGEPGRGIRNIAHLFNVTRLYNACTSVACYRRLLELSRDYAGKRQTFGRPLAQHPLHKKILHQLEAQLEKCFALTFYTVLVLGRSEDTHGEERERDLRLLRLLTPLAKLTTAKHAVSAASELVESFGGAGYVEDTGIPRFLRDAQVFPIWEGTTNILALDTLRAIDRDQALPCYLDEMQGLLQGQDESLQRRLDELAQNIAQWRQDQTRWEENSRTLAFELADIAGEAVLGRLRREQHHPR